MKENLKRIMKKEVSLFGESYPLGDVLLVGAGVVFIMFVGGINF